MQNTRTHIAMCMRDKCCLITGQAAVRRSRGGNFTGLEVAHIFPLMGVGSVSRFTFRNLFVLLFHIQGEWTMPLSVSTQQLIITCQVADRPHNWCYSSLSRCSQFIWWLSVEHMGMSLYLPILCPLMFAIVWAWYSSSCPLREVRCYGFRWHWRHWS